MALLGHELEDGTIQTVAGTFVPPFPGNADYDALMLAVAQGGTIEPYTPPVVDLFAYAAEKRWECEVGGTTWNGWPVRTDRVRRTNMITECLAIEAEDREDPDVWKFADGEFRLISNEDFVELANTVRDHVRQCFLIEAQVIAGIAAEQITTTEEIDAAFA